MAAGPGDELATGGTVSYDGDFVVHTFTADDSFALVEAGTLSVEYCVVGGGGAGGSVEGGGGGAGGVVQGSTDVTSTQSVTVGAGGAPALRTIGGDGSASSFGAISASGGGGGGGELSRTGANGGSGGGGAATYNTGTNPGGTGIVGQGHDGGQGFGTTSSGRYAGGGGGAGAAAVVGNGTGGAGVETFSGSGVYVGGGGGGYDRSGQNWPGGIGGGGTGGQANTVAATSGTPNTGGGGGGGDYGATNYGGSGGSGVVILRYDPAVDWVPDDEPPAEEPAEPLVVPVPDLPVASPLVWVYGLDGEQDFPLPDIDGLVIEDRLGEVSSISFSIQASDPRAGLILPDCVVRWGTRYFRVQEIAQTRGSSGATVAVYGEALYTDLGRKIRFGNFPVLGQTPTVGLGAILKGTDWTAVDGDAGEDAILYSREGYDESVLAHLVGWASLCGYELDFDEEAKTVGLVDAVGQDRGVGFRYGSNVTEIRRRYEPPRATVLYGVGANSLTFESVNPTGEAYVEDFSWYVAQGLTLSQARELHTKEQVFVDSGFLVALNLYDRTVERLALLAQPIISYECSVIDLARATGGTGVPFEIGDTVRVRDEVFGVDLSTRIVRRIYRPFVPGGDEIELSYLRTTDTATETRSQNYDSISILVDATTSATVVTAAVDYAEIALNTTGTTTAAVGSTFLATASGSGTVKFSFIADAAAVGGEWTVDFADGELVEFSFPSYVADLEAGAHLLTFRASIISGSGTLTIAPNEARGWVLANGAFGLGVDTSPNRRVIEELLLVDYSPTAESFDVVLHGVTAGTSHIVESDAETLTLDPLGLSESYRTPFIIGDPEFGVLGGPGTLS